MTASLKIDFVSDVSCPWCAVGLSSLERALERLQGDVQAELHFQPFELNPQMPAGGQDIGEHLTQKYGSTPEQQAQIRERIRERGAEVGFTFRKEGRGRIYNTFDAHRLLHWAEGGASDASPNSQHALKKALLGPTSPTGKRPNRMRCCSAAWSAPDSTAIGQRTFFPATNSPPRCANASVFISTRASIRCLPSSSTTAT